MKTNFDSKFIPGSVYFLIRYLDQGFSYPRIETVVYLEKNSNVGHEDGDKWLFQDAESYCSNDPRSTKEDTRRVPAQQTNTSQGRIYRFAKESLADIYTCEELISELKEYADGTIGSSPF